MIWLITVFAGIIVGQQTKSKWRAALLGAGVGLVVILLKGVVLLFVGPTATGEILLPPLGDFPSLMGLGAFFSYMASPREEKKAP